MRRSRQGFTLIEVAIFLAITGVLFVGVTVGVQNSIYQQRTNDSVQNFEEFLRNVYSEVLNVQNTRGGRSEKAIYGKLITFGERYDLAGTKLVDEETEFGGNTIFVYTVIGDVSNSRSGGTLELLHGLNANVVEKTIGTDGETGIVLAGIAESYTPKWSAQIEPSCGEDDKVTECSYTPMKGMVLIARHPNSGMVSTYYSSELSEVNGMFYDAKRAGNWDVNLFDKSTGGGNYLVDGDFRMDQIDFCINTTGEKNVYNRADVRIVEGARNASGIELVSSESEGYRCGK